MFLSTSKLNTVTRIIEQRHRFDFNKRFCIVFLNIPNNSSRGSSGDRTLFMIVRNPLRGFRAVSSSKMGAKRPFFKIKSMKKSRYVSRIIYYKI